MDASKSFHPIQNDDHKAESIGKLEAHVKSKHKVMYNKIPTPMKVLPSTPTTEEHNFFKCFICPNDYYIAGGWEDHAKIAHVFKCASCDKTFPTLDDRNEHSSNDHSTHPVNSELVDLVPLSDNPVINPIPKLISKILKCDKCDFAATEQATMHAHKENAHGSVVCITGKKQDPPELLDILPALPERLDTKDPQYVHDPPAMSEALFRSLPRFHCMLCGKGFAEESYLNKHAKAQHDWDFSRELFVNYLYVTWLLKPF